MRGRVQAAFVAFVGSIFPIVGGAAVALVTLRRGYFDGAMVLLAAMVGFLLLYSPAISSEEPFFKVLGYSVIWLPFVVFAAAQVLRATVSWPLSLLAVVVCGGATGLVFAVFFADIIQATLDWYKEFLAQNGGRAQELEQGRSMFHLVAAEQVTGYIASSAAQGSVLALVLGRWWQSVLFNPGGFRQEFLALKLGKTQSLICFGVGAICIAQTNWEFWALLALLPLAVTSIATAHLFVAANRIGTFWLVLFYLAMITSEWFMLGMALLSFADVWWDLRAKIMAKSRGDDNDRRH